MELIILIVLGLLARVILVINSSIDFDTYGHLYYAKEVKEQKAGPFGKIKIKVVESDEYRHPFLWHWILGFLPLNFKQKNSRCINLILELAFLGLIYPIIAYVYGHVIGLYTITLYLYTPILFSSISTGPRINSLTPRITSEIAVNLYLIIIFFPLPVSGLVKIGIITLLGSYTLLSSKFGIQAIVLLSLLISLLMFSIEPLFYLILSIVFATFITQGEFFKTFRHQIRHLHWYFKKNLKKDTFISNRNSLSTIKSKAQDKKGLKKIAIVLRHMLKINSFGVVLLKMPVLTVGLFLFFNSNHQLPSFISLTVIASVLLYIIINIPVLLFIGEAERYLNHVIIFIILMTAILTFESGEFWSLWGAIVYGFIYWIFELIIYPKLMRSHTTRSSDIKEQESIIDYLQSIEKKKVILLFPYHTIGVYRVMLETIHDTIFFNLISPNWRKRVENNYETSYPKTNINKLNEMNTDFGLDLLIVNNQAVKDTYPEGWTPPSNWQKETIAGEVYSVYSRL